MSRGNAAIRAIPAAGVEQTLTDVQLQRGGSQQVTPANDVIHTHQQVVNRDNQLIGEQTIRPSHHRIAKSRGKSNRQFPNTRSCTVTAARASPATGMAMRSECRITIRQALLDLSRMLGPAHAGMCRDT